MADKPKPKSASQGKAKAAKPANGKTAKSADAAPAASKAAAAKTATAKTAGKKGKAKAGKAAGGSHGAKQSKSAAPAVEKHVEAHAPIPVETFYVCSGVLPIEIRDTPPASGAGFVEFASFDAARDHFLDELIEAIEQYERVLHAVRGTTSFAHYLAQHG
jgi:hypothetical protein